MAIFSSEKVIVYLKNKSIEFYKEGVGEKAWLEFPDNIISDQEIKDQSSLEKLIFEFLEKTGLEKQQALIILSDELSFQKIVPATDSENEQFEVKKFLEQIPFEAPTIATLLVRSDTQLDIFAANKNLFFGIKNILEKYGWQVVAVVPSAIYENLSKDSLKPEEVVRALNDKKLIKKSNFLTETNSSQLTIKTPQTASLLTIVLVFILAGILGFLSLKFNLLSKLPLFKSSHQGIPQDKVQETSSSGQNKNASSESTQSSSLSAKPNTSFDKQQAKVQILNGSGVFGQATKLKDKIAELDYKNIQTGNATSSSQQETTITYTALVSTQIRDELNNLLNSLFEKVIISEGSLDSYDILITTGQSKAPL
ncbi:LytR C-terminal domain-containing protein [Candidatus Daviesbacteria bacterium]|nr:LytR C-terminal domain-containing protein [Candidatus Daviesbacteria bacterium]